MTASKLNIALLILVAVLVFFLQRSCNKIDKGKQYKTLYEKAQDTLNFTYDNLGRQTAYVSVLEVENANMFKELKTTDTTIQKLQDVVKNYKGKINTAVVFETKTETIETIKEVFVTKFDTSLRDSITLVYPEYFVEWDGKWSSGFIRATKDSIQRSFNFRNEFEITLGAKKNKWFRPKEQMVEVKSLNPNTSTAQLRSFSVKQKPKRLSIVLYVGYGLDLSSLRLAPSVGFGIAYTILPIK